MVDVRHYIMSLWNNTTELDPLISNKSAQDQVDSSCFFVDSSAERFFKLCAFCFILLGSLFGNIFIIIIVCKNRDLRKTMNYFIVNMALSDLVFTMTVLPVKITELVTASLHWYVTGILGSILCKLFFFAGIMSLFVSTQSLVWIAIDRFVAVVFPMKLGLISSKIRTIAIVSTWICAGLFNFPLLKYSKLVPRGNDTGCAETNVESFLSNKKANITYIWLQFSLFISSPLVVITVLYTAIAITLKLQKKALVNPCKAQRHVTKKRRQAIKMTVAILVFYYICVFPNTLVYFFPYLRPSCEIAKKIFFVSSLLLHLSSTVNPIICLSFVQSYRRGLRNVLCPCVGRKL